MKSLPRIALAQINPTVGDLDGNAALIADWIAKAHQAGVDGIVAVVGYAEPVGHPVGRAIAANAAAVIADGQVRQVYRKRLLPNYGVFDEYRTFRNGSGPLVADAAGTALGLTVCEDCWEPESDVARDLAPGPS